MMKLRDEFYKWLQEKYSNKGTIQSRLSNVERIFAEYDLDLLYALDGCEGLLNDFEYSAEDCKKGYFPNVKIVIHGDYISGMSTLRHALKLYIEFLGEDSNKAYIKSVKESVSQPGIAIYKGDLANFKKFIGGYCRNKVNYMAKKERDKLNGICECCGQKKTLQSAHRTGEERVQIIEDILDKHFKKGSDYYEVDLIEFEDLFEKYQIPIADHFFFLCKDCHNSYDEKGKDAGKVTTAMLIAKRDARSKS